MERRNLTTAIMLLIFTSCGRSNKPVTIDTKGEVNGSLHDYLQVIPAEYDLSQDGDFKIKIQGIKSASDSLITDDKKVLLKASLLNKKGMPVSGIDELQIESNDEAKLIELLKRGSGEEIVSLHTFYSSQIREHLSEIAGITITSLVREKEWGEGKKIKESETPQVSKANTEINDPSVQSDSQDWDKMIDDCDAIADKYLVLLKKVKLNDPTAISEYPGLLEKAQDLDNQLNKAKSYNLLTPNQLKRMAEIQHKMVMGAVVMESQ